MSRKDERKDISPVRLHSKKFNPASVVETILNDGSIQMIVQGRASTTEKDYDGDIIDPAGIDLVRYNLNPIVKMGHKREVEYNVGLSTVSVKNIGGINGLWIDATVTLNPEIPEHKIWIHGIRHGTINGWSIGFAKVIIGKDADGNRTITSCELHEVSLVDIPNNPLTVRKTLTLAEHMKYGTKQLDLASLVTGQMIRYVKTEHFSDWDGDVYEWSYCNNAEVVKIDGSMVYLLVYELTLNGFVPTKWLEVCAVDEVTMVDISEEQLKGLKDVIETKNVTETTETIESTDTESTAVEMTDATVEAVTETTDITPIDAQEVEEVEVVEVIAEDQETDDSEKSLGNEEANHTKQLSDYQSMIETKEAELVTTKALVDSMQKELIEKDDLIEQATEGLTKVLDENKTLRDTIEKATNNFKQLGMLYQVDEVKEAHDPLQGRIKKM